MSLELNCFLDEKKQKKKSGVEFEDCDYRFSVNLTELHLQYTHLSAPENGEKIRSYVNLRY